VEKCLKSKNTGAEKERNKPVELVFFFFSLSEVYSWKWGCSKGYRRARPNITNSPSLFRLHKPSFPKTTI